MVGSVQRVGAGDPGPGFGTSPFVEPPPVEVNRRKREPRGHESDETLKEQDSVVRFPGGARFHDTPIIADPGGGRFSAAGGVDFSVPV